MDITSNSRLKNIKSNVSTSFTPISCLMNYYEIQVHIDIYNVWKSTMFILTKIVPKWYFSISTVFYYTNSNHATASQYVECM